MSTITFFLSILKLALLLLIELQPLKVNWVKVLRRQQISFRFFLTTEALLTPHHKSIKIAKTWVRILAWQADLEGRSELREPSRNLFSYYGNFSTAVNSVSTAPKKILEKLNYDLNTRYTLART